MKLGSGIIIILLLHLFTLEATAQGENQRLPVKEKSFRFFFKQGKSNLDLHYKKNDSTLCELLFYYERIKATCEIVEVKILSSASPEGSYSLNNTLSVNRLESLISLLKNTNCSLILNNVRKNISIGEDWKGLATLVKASNIIDKQELLLTISNCDSTEHKKKGLKEFQNGFAWKYMSKIMFPQLRSAVLTIKSTPIDVIKEEVQLPKIQLSCDKINSLMISKAPEIPIVHPMNADGIIHKQQKSISINLRSNLFMDALLIPNIGLEFYLGNNISLITNWNYAWWKNDKTHKYWRIYGGDVEIRKYFSSSESASMSGHHLGIYGLMLTYDFEMGSKGYLSDKWSFGGGISYGYSLPLLKRLNIDFTIGMGYLGGTYQIYIPKDNHYVWQSTKKRNWFVPTKAEISLVWRLGSENTNYKGGAR